MKKNKLITGRKNTISVMLIIGISILFFYGNAYAQPAVYTAQAFNANIPGYPTFTAGANFKTPTVDWTQAKIAGNGSAPNDFEWVNAGANPAAANQNIAGFPTGAGFVRYINRTAAYPAASGAVNGDAAFLATRSLDWSGHTAYSATADTIGISVWRDGTAGALLNVLDYIEVYVNTNARLSGATLALTTSGANRINRSSSQTPLGSTPNAWNRYKFVIPNDARFWGGTGGSSNAYIIIAGFSAGGNNIFIDNINLPQWQTQMKVTGASVYVTENFDVGKSTVDNVMMGIQITTKGSLNPRRIDGLLFSKAGSTSFITDVPQPNGAKCWFTGASTSFATTLGVISVPKVNPTAASYTNGNLFFGSLNAVSGCPDGLTTATYNFFPGEENFIWLAYDINAAPTAISGHNVAANFEQLFTGWSSPSNSGCINDTIVTVSGIQIPASVGAFTPSPSTSAVRQIVDQAYNIPTYTNGTSRQGGSYQNNDYVSGVHIAGDNSTLIDNYEHNSICGACVAVAGTYCTRFSCHPPDYTQFPPTNLGITQNRGPLQLSQGHGVRKGTAPYTLQAQCGTWFSSNCIGVFIDWNKDGDFDDRYGTGAGVNAYIYENYGSHQQVTSNMAIPPAAVVWQANSSWNIDVPLPTDVVTDLADPGQPNSPGSNNTGPIIIGNVRMRIREIYAAPNSVAGVIGVHPTNSGFTWGEVEDYTVQVLDGCPAAGANICKWVGATNDWSNPQNWCPAIPTKNDIAYINAGPANMPTILDNTNAVCRTLRIMPGANMKIDATKNSSLIVYDDVEIGSGATIGTGSYIAVTSDLNTTISIPGKSSVPPLGLALSPLTPFKTNAQQKTQIAYTATELQNTYGWKPGDVIDQISIEVHDIQLGVGGTSNFQKLRIQAFLTTTPVTYAFPPVAGIKAAVMAGDLNVVAGWPKTIYPVIAPDTNITLNLPQANNGTQAGGNYYTFNLKPNTLIWDGTSNLVLSFENITPIGLTPAKNYTLYDEPGGGFTVLALTNNTITAGVLNGQNLAGKDYYWNGASYVASGAGLIPSTVSNNRPRLDFKWHRPYNQFPITIGGDWINNNRFSRSTVYSTTPVYGIPGDSGFIASNSRVIFDPTGRGTVSSAGLSVANPPYTLVAPGVTLPADVDQDITSLSSGVANSTVFNVLQINKVSATGKAVKQNSTLTPLLTGHYADTLVLTAGELSLNRKEFTLRQPAAAALVSSGSSWLRSEDNIGGLAGTIESKFTWKIGTANGTYTIPFKSTTSGTSVFNLKYTKISGDVGDLTVGTYGTPVANTPFPFPALPVGNPLHVVAMTTNLPVLDATPWTIDRFWFIKRSTTSALTSGSTLRFEYDNTIEGTATATYVSGEMKAQRYELISPNTGWHTPYPSQSDGVGGGAIRYVNHPAKFIDNTYCIWTIVHTNGVQPPLGGGGCTTTSPTITPNGPTTFCTGSVALTSSTATSYLWSTGATTKSITVSTSGSYTVMVSDVSGCTGISVPTVVTAGITATITTGGPTTFCQNDSVLLSGTSAATYTWSTGATTQSIYVKTASTYYVVAANANGCTALSNSIVVTVNTLPVATITAGGPTTFCLGDSVTLTSSTGAAYLWSTGATTKSIKVFNTGTYTVTVTKANGCSKKSNSVNVTVGVTPPPTITANGPITFCSGGSVALTSSSSSSYNWSTGATTQSITVNTTGSYFVAITGTGGCTTQSNTINVTVTQGVTPTISASGPTTFCPGQNVILSCSPASTYLWSTGATSQSIAVSTAGSFVVTITDAGGCTAVSAPKIVTVTCVKPTGLSATNITSSSAKTNWNVVSCAAGYRVQYRLNGTTTWTTKINITTNFKNLTGLLSSTVYDWRVATKCPDGSYSAYTAIQNFTTLVLKQESSFAENDRVINLFPNPGTDIVYLQSDETIEPNATVFIYDMTGRKMNVGISKSDEFTFEIKAGSLAEGAYTVALMTDKMIEKKKLIIAR
ncbi:MAG: T9SS type A sorting domain-containing protein [Bacteroidia bacterium]